MQVINTTEKGQADPNTVIAVATVNLMLYLSTTFNNGKIRQYRILFLQGHARNFQGSLQDF